MSSSLNVDKVNASEVNIVTFDTILAKHQPQLEFFVMLRLLQLFLLYL
jgi:hypothetical protein